MKLPQSVWYYKRTSLDLLCRIALGLKVFICFANSTLAAPALPQGELLATNGIVEFTKPKANWVPAAIGMKLVEQDRLRTLTNSRAMLRLAELGRLRMNELTTLEVLPPRETTSKATLDLRSGAIYFFTRDKPREFLLQTPHAIGASRGTEFLVTVDPARTVLTVFDGEVVLSNAQASVSFTNGEQGFVLPGQPPVKVPVLQATNVVQWWLYYPGVLDIQELPFTPAESALLAASTTTYTQGDLRQALDNYPAGRSPQSDAERVYYAALLLSVGQVEKTETLLASISAPFPQADALREVIATVTGRQLPATREPRLASEYLARSYAQQPTNLAAALASARAAVRISPAFGFGWERVAELEFSFGHTHQAEMALDKALALSPRNAEAFALKGFVLSAQNRIGTALKFFEQAIEIDGSLGNGWLGRGLCRIRKGQTAEGRRDLQTAAALEPNRSLLRSYLGKAFSDAYDTLHAERELALARRLDPNDPTPWLYESWLDFEDNKVNDAVRDVEASQARNENRQVYRSRLLLDEDRAVGSSSLATIYRGAGLERVSVNEATRAVTYDYGNYSAHLFLADSLNALRDPTRFNLRYETAWFNELLLANLLAPAGTRAISQNISQQEYSRLFERDRLALDSTSEYRSDGQFRELASQYGSLGRLSYSLDLDYQHNDGIRLNNDLSRIEWYSQIKQQLSPYDTLMVLAKYQDYHSGDNFQYYYQTNLHPHFRFDEYQTPLIVGGYHREWAPGVHTLVLAGRLENEQKVSDQNVRKMLLRSAGFGEFALVADQPFTNFTYHSEFETYTAELNQIFQTEHQTLVLGGRFQDGQFTTSNRLEGVSPFLVNFFPKPPADANVTEDFRRYSLYAYETLKLPTELLLTEGVSYDAMDYPDNFRFAPVTDGSAHRDLLAPKAAVSWSPLAEVTFRAAYSKALGGVSFDESFRLEPTQLAGFNQASRSIISESVVGSLAGPSYEILGSGVDFKLPTRSYLTLQAQYQGCDADQDIGVFYAQGGKGTAGKLPEELRYKETSFLASFNQLLGRDWSAGVDYRYTDSKLRWFYPTLSAIPAGHAPLNRTETADLHQVDAFVLFTHPSGFYATAEAQWYHQNNSGYTPGLPKTDFVQVNLLAGLRFFHRRADVAFGVLNVGGDDFHLNPLNVYNELPRSRVFLGRVRISF
jgi:Tfp pilus assembly protein PilF